MQNCQSPNYDERPPGTVIDMLVLHYTGMKSAKEAMERLCDPHSNVSAHYMIDEDGRIFKLVSEGFRAWHAGVAFWRGNQDINTRSIGIEMVNPGHEFGLKPFTERQMAALEILAIDILKRHPVPGRNVVGHSDVAPCRKEDPGELFDWFRLHKRGIGVWPESVKCKNINEHCASTLLRSFGYEINDFGKTLKAFQRHFRPTKVDGELDTETIQLLNGLERY